MGSSKSNTGRLSALRYAMPITSLTCTSRQARTHRLHWMQASMLTRIAGWLASVSQCASCARAMAGKRLSATPVRSAQPQKAEVGSCDPSRSGWSATSSSITKARDFRARSVCVCTRIAMAGTRLQLGARVRSPSISTMQTRQLPSGR